MAITTPSSYGLIMLRGSRAEAFLLDQWQPSPEQVEAHLDDKLFGLAVAQSPFALEDIVKLMAAEDLRPGRDFAITSSAEGIFADSATPWLAQVGERLWEFKG